MTTEKRVAYSVSFISVTPSMLVDEIKLNFLIFSAIQQSGFKRIFLEDFQNEYHTGWVGNSMSRGTQIECLMHMQTAKAQAQARWGKYAVSTEYLQQTGN